MKNLTSCKLLIGTLTRPLCIGPGDKLSENVAVDEAIKLRPDTEWCIQEKPENSSWGNHPGNAF